MTVQSPDQVSARFGVPVQWAQMHVGEHRCVDGRMYRASCLLTDPTCDSAARSYMRLAGVDFTDNDRYQSERVSDEHDPPTFR